MIDDFPSPLPSRYTRACLLFGAVLAGSIPPCLAVGLLAPSLPDLGFLRWVILTAPAAIAGALALVATYYLNQAEQVAALRPAPSRVAGAALTLFVIGALTLALPAALFVAVPDSTVIGPLSPGDSRLEVLRQRALRHADMRVRVASARTIYLVSGEAAPYRDASRIVVEFSPSTSDLRQVTLRRWMAARPGATPEERRLLAGTALIMVTGVLIGLPVAGALGRRGRRLLPL